MKHIVTAVMVLFCGTISAQIYTPETPTVYGIHQKRDKVDSARHVPEKSALTTNTLDTSAQIFYYKVDSSMYGYSRAKGFFRIGDGGSGGGGVTITDTIFLSEWAELDSISHPGKQTILVRNSHGDSIIHKGVYVGAGPNPPDGYSPAYDSTNDRFIFINTSAITSVTQYKWSVLDSADNVSSPGQGNIYLVSTAPSGSFTGQSNNIAIYDTTSGFSFYTATVGDLLYNATTQEVSKWTGTVWLRVTINNYVHILYPETILGHKSFADTLTLLAKPIQIVTTAGFPVSLLTTNAAGVTYPWLKIDGDAYGSKITMGANNIGSAADQLRIIANYTDSIWTGTYRPLHMDIYDYLDIRANRSGIADSAIRFRVGSNAAGIIHSNRRWTLNGYAGRTFYQNDTTAYKPVVIDNSGNISQSSWFAGGGVPVTTVTASSPLASSGGTTPNVTITQANTSVSGYLSSTDWNTFNNKGAGTVTSASLTMPGVLFNTSVTGSPITTSGTFSPTLISQSSYTVLGNHTSGSTTPTFGKLPVNSISATGALTSRSVLHGDGVWRDTTAAATGESTTASNGVTLSGVDVKLGGSMTAGTTISSNFNLFFTGSLNNAALLSAQNSSATGAVALQGITIGGNAIDGLTTTGTAVRGSASGTGNGINGKSRSGFAGTFTEDSIGLVPKDMISLNGVSTQTAAAGMGIGIVASVPNTGGGSGTIGRIRFITDNPTVSAYSGSIHFQTAKVAAMADKFVIDSAGKLRANLYGAGTFTGTPTYSLNVDANGNFIEGSVGTSGAVTSVTASSPLSSSGGATPNITVSQSNTSTDGYLSSTDWNTFNGKGSGTVTNVSALTLGTTGTDLSSSVANSTTTPVITLNVPTASASNRGALSSSDWSTFNGHTSSIATNTTNIATNTSSISTNTTNIATNTTAIATKITRSISSISSTTTGAAAAVTDYVYLCTGTFTYTQPTAVSNTDRYVIKNVGTGVITMAFTSSQTIDGATSLSVLAGNSVELISDNSNWKIIQPISGSRQVLVSNVQLNNTANTTTENTIYTGTIPANTLNANGSLQFYMMISSTNNANGKTWRLKINGTQIAQMGISSTATAMGMAMISNRNSLSSQVAFTAFTNNSFAVAANVTSSGAIATYSFNTAADMTITVTIQNATSTDVSAIERFNVIAIN